MIGRTILIHGMVIATLVACSTAAPVLRNSETAIASASNTKFSLPPYSIKHWRNGLTVFLMQDHEVPLVEFRVVVRAGSENDDGTNGLAYLAGQSLRLGGALFNKQDLDEQLDFYGAQLGIASNKDATTIALSGANENTDELLAVLADIVLNPAFPVTEFEKLRLRHLNQLAQRKQHPREVLGDYFDQLVYPAGHPYASPTVGEQDIVKGIEQSDITAFYRQYYSPPNTALIVVGDFDASEMSAALALYFGQWIGEAAPLLSADEYEMQLQPARVWLINKDDAKETMFAIGGPSIPANHDDFIPVSVVNTVLGGRFSSWLMQALRVESGLSYGAGSRIAAHGQAGSFRLSSFTQNETTFEAIDLALATYDRLWSEGISSNELASVKTLMRGQFPPRFETNGQRANFIANMWAQNLSPNYVKDYLGKLDEVDIATVKRVITEHFPRDNLQFVLIGQADSIRQTSAKYGILSESPITEPTIHFPFE